MEKKIKKKGKNFGWIISILFIQEQTLVSDFKILQNLLKFFDFSTKKADTAIKNGLPLAT